MMLTKDRGKTRKGTNAQRSSEAVVSPSADRLVINVVRESDGYTFALDLDTRRKLRSSEAGAKPALPPRSFVAFDVEQRIEDFLDAILQHVIPLLTGLTLADLQARDIELRDPWEGKTIKTLSPAHR